MKKQGRDSWDLGGEGESWDIWIFWQTGEIYGLEWVIAFKQSSPEWNEQGQRRQDPWHGCRLILIILLQIGLVDIKERFLVKLNINIISINLKILLLVPIIWVICIFWMN